MDVNIIYAFERERNRLKAENKRLKEALESIFDTSDMRHTKSCSYEALGKVFTISKQALEENE